MKQFYSPQKSNRSPPLCPRKAHLSLSQPKRTLSIDSPSPQHLNMIDPECFSPLTFPSSKSGTPAKLQNLPSYDLSSPCEASKRFNLCKKLKVESFSVLRDRNEVPCLSSAFDQNLNQSSTSTSANSPDYIDLSHCKDNNPNISQFSNENQVESLFIKRTSSTIDEYIAQTTGSSLVTAEESKLDVSQSNPMMTNSMSDNTGQGQNIDRNQAEEVNAEDDDDTHTNFADTLEFLLDKTPVITIFMSLISLSLISGIAVSVLEGKNSHRFIFAVLYVFLVYILIQKTLKMFKSHAPNRPTFIELSRGEPFYNTLDAIGYIVIASVANLRTSGMITSLWFPLYFHIGVLAMYSGCSRLPGDEKVYGIFKRAMLVFQLAVVIYKVDNELVAPWKIVLCSGWIVIAAYMVRLFEGAVQIFTAISGHAMLRVISLTSKVITIIALVLLFVDLIILMMVLVGVCKVLDGEDEKMEFLKSWLTVSQYLNAFLLLFTTIAGADLFEFILTAAEYFNPTKERDAKPKQFVFSTKETFLLRMSPTYYKILKDGENSIKREITPLQAEEVASCGKKEGQALLQDKDDELNKKESCEDNMCYICCGKNADGVILDCGHGGICYECLTDYVNKKSECMECRKKISSILKIESEVEQDKMFKGDKVCQVVESQEDR